MMEWRMWFMLFFIVAIYAQEGGLNMDEVEGVQLEESDGLELESEEAVETEDEDNDCVYTDSEGNYCDCNADKTCIVAQVHFEACADNQKSTSLQFLVNQCVPASGKGKFRSFKQRCRNGVVTKQWHHSADCSDNAARTDFVSDGFKSCVKVVCDEEESPFEAVVEAMESGANMPLLLSSSSIYTLIIASLMIVLLF